MKVEDTQAARQHIEGIDPPKRRDEAMTLDTLFQEVTGFQPKLWAGRMIGYGLYNYTYDSGHSGTSLATGFAVAPRQLTIYVLPGYTAFPEHMARLGKYRRGKSCLYLTKLENANEAVLRDLIRVSLDDLASRWKIEPT